MRLDIVLDVAAALAMGALALASLEAGEEVVFTATVIVCIAFLGAAVREALKEAGLLE